MATQCAPLYTPNQPKHKSLNYKYPEESFSFAGILVNYPVKYLLEVGQILPY